MIRALWSLQLLVSIVKLGVLTGLLIMQIQQIWELLHAVGKKMSLQDHMRSFYHHIEQTWYNFKQNNQYISS